MGGAGSLEACSFVGKPFSDAPFACIMEFATLKIMRTVPSPRRQASFMPA